MDGETLLDMKRLKITKGHFWI
jgi:hypothetical protein